MKAIVKTAPGEDQLAYMDFPEPSPGENEVKIRVVYAGICGTDLSIRKGTFKSYPPVVMGHEYSGIVDSVGAGVSKFKKGDRVVSETAQVICGTCYQCLSGHYLMCDKRLSIGYGVNGALAEYIVVRQEIVHRVPDTVEMDEAAMCEPAACAFHAVFDHVHVKPVHTVLIIGPGAMGQLAAQFAMLAGANVIVCGTAADKPRLDLVQSLGAKTLVVEPDTDTVARILALNNGEEIDIAFDCAGVADSINCCLNSLKRRGSLVAVGLSKPTINFDYNLIPMRELKVYGSYAHINSSWSGALAVMASGRLKLKPLMSRKFAFSEWEAAFEALVNSDGVKVLLQPDGDA